MHRATAAKHRVVLLVSAAALTSVLPRQPASGSLPAAQERRLDVVELDRMIARHVADQQLVGLSVGVMQQGKVVLAKGYGLRSLESRDPVTAETMFAIASVTKQFTCAAVMLLAQDGQLALDDRVAKYDNTLTRAGDITLLDLGQHVAGYRDYYPLDFVDRPMARDRPVDEIVRDYARRPLDFEPGTRWSYSNTGYLILGRVVEWVSGQEFGGFLQRRVFAPLKLRHTGYALHRDDARVARGYTSFGFGALEPATPEGAGWIAAAGGLWSTPTDLLAWNLALMDGRILSESSYRVMTTPRRLPDGRSTGYGCGQSVQDNGAALVLTHGGATSGFRTSNTFIPATRSGVVLMANRDFAVLNPLREAILAKLLPASDVPAVRGEPAEATVRAFLRNLREQTVDRAQLGEEYSAYLTDARIAEAAQTLARNEPSEFETAALSERGGMEVSRIRFKLGRKLALALMYRTPDGRIQQFLFFRQ
ncbi:MAG: serine hydrolase domain-containing protein [Gemmatimonadales bacterium]